MKRVITLLMAVGLLVGVFATVGAMAEEPPEGSGYTFTLENTCDGVVVSWTGTDPDPYLSLNVAWDGNGYGEWYGLGQTGGSTGLLPHDTELSFSMWWTGEGDHYYIPSSVEALDGTYTAPEECTVVPEPEQIVVDGVLYDATKVSGPTVHYETPDVNPVEAYTDRHVWDGKHGAEHLPCPYGIHWIDNSQLLTISNCLPGPPPTTTTSSTTSTTTTTTTQPTTTTTEGTTTTTEGTTTTTEGTTTTTEGDTTTTTAGDTTTTVPTSQGDLDESGMPLMPIGLATAGALLLLAGAALNATRRSES